MVSTLSSSPGTTRVELAVEEIAQDDAAKLKTQIHLSTLKYIELVALTSQECKNETDRLNAVLAITSADGKSAEWNEEKPYHFTRKVGIRPLHCGRTSPKRGNPRGDPSHLCPTPLLLSQYHYRWQMAVKRAEVNKQRLLALSPEQQNLHRLQAPNAHDQNDAYCLGTTSVLHHELPASRARGIWGSELNCARSLTYYVHVS